MNTKPKAILFNDTRVDQHHGCSAVMHTIERMLETTGFDIIHKVPSHVDWSSDPVFTTALEKAQIAIVNGEGTIHHDRPAGRKLLEVGEAAKSNDIPAILLNMGWEANGGLFSELLRAFSMVGVRDSNSWQELQNLGHASEVMPDLSLCYPYQPDATRMRSIPVLVTDSVKRHTALDLDRLARMQGGETISIFNTQTGLDTYLGFLRAGFAKEDLLKPRTFMALVSMRHRLWRAATDTPDAFLDRLAQANLLISGRFHACTLALRAGTPFIGVRSNTRKIEALAADAGLEPWRVVSKIDDSVSDLCRDARLTPTERSNVADYVTGAEPKVTAFFKSMRALV